jgi:TRAP-type C4-dicarboxylate transport system permease small subunit
MRFKDIDTVIKRLCYVLNGIAGIILALLVILLVLNIFGRVIKCPITGSYEAVQYGFSLTVSFAVAYTAVQNQHISIDLIFKRYPKKIRNSLEFIGDLLIIFMFTLLTWRLCVNGMEAYILGENSSTLGWPVFLFQFALALGFAMLALVILLKLLKGIGVGKCHQ